jgi:hypothetical protein
MPKRVTRDWLSRAAMGLTSGALALSVLTAAGGTASPAGVRSALAEDIDCYNDKDLYDLPECVERRANDRKGGMQQNEAQGATGQGTEAPGGGQQQSAGGQQPSGGGQQQASGGNQGAPAGGGQQQQSAGGPPPPSGGGSQQPAQAAAEEEDDDAPEVHMPATDPKQVVLKIGDAGKEATQYLSEEGSDKYGPWARTRFERDRSNGASALGPNVMDSKVWITKDVETAKTLFKEQAAVKNFPERTEEAKGTVDKVKPPAFGEEFSFVTAYYEDRDSKVFQHYRFVSRVGKAVAVVYLFGREEFFQDQKERTWTGEGEWYYKAVIERM